MKGGPFHNVWHAKAVSSFSSLEGDQRCRVTATARRRHDTLLVGDWRVLGSVAEPETRILVVNQIAQTQKAERVADDSDSDAL